jgi:Holliday junction resolvase-like predicted endonuclease
VNAFENIVAQYLEAEGYWVKQDVKVKISKEDKKAIGLPTMPRPEIDIVALNVEENELLLIEVKSYLDSYGVYFEAVSDEDDHLAYRYRLFTDRKFREVVTKRLHEQYLTQGLIKESTRINYALAAGNIHSEQDESKIKSYFSKRRWKLFSPKEIKGKIMELSEKGWEDNVITMTTKLLLRE